MSVDLYLDGSIGIWALSQVQPNHVGTVVTTDNAVRAYSQQRQFETVLGAPGAIEFANKNVALSVHYHCIFSATCLARYEKMYNLHPGFLPWGRGYYPVFWALWEQTPAGATLHEISIGIDKGPIVAQLPVPYSENDTGGTLHCSVQQAERDLFTMYFSRIVAGDVLPSREQPLGGSYHSKADFLRVSQSRFSQDMSPEDRQRLARALTFP
jgi:methionyl-tRNA formyltransferase